MADPQLLDLDALLAEPTLHHLDIGAPYYLCREAASTYLQAHPEYASYINYLNLIQLQVQNYFLGRSANNHIAFTLLNQYIISPLIHLIWKWAESSGVLCADLANELGYRLLSRRTQLTPLVAQALEAYWAKETYHPYLVTVLERATRSEPKSARSSLQY